MSFRVALLDYKGNVIPAKNVDTRIEADDYVLEMVIKYGGIKKGYIENLETKERESLEDIK